MILFNSLLFCLFVLIILCCSVCLSANLSVLTYVPISKPQYYLISTKHLDKLTWSVNCFHVNLKNTFRFSQGVVIKRTSLFFIYLLLLICLFFIIHFRSSIWVVVCFFFGKVIWYEKESFISLFSCFFFLLFK